MKSRVMRSICIAFIERLILFLPDFDTRYAVIIVIKNPLKQSWTNREAFRTQTCSIAPNYDYLPKTGKSQSKRATKIILNKHCTAYHTFRSINASPNSLHPLKVLLMKSAFSSINMSSKILLLYFGVAARRIQFQKFMIVHLEKVEIFHQYLPWFRERMLFLSKLNFDKVKKDGAVGIIFTENVILLDSRTAEQLTSKSFCQ